MIHSYLQYFHHPPHHRDQVRVTARKRQARHHPPRIRYTRQIPLPRHFQIRAPIWGATVLRAVDQIADSHSPRNLM